MRRAQRRHQRGLVAALGRIDVRAQRHQGQPRAGGDRSTGTGRYRPDPRGKLVMNNARIISDSNAVNGAARAITSG